MAGALLVPHDDEKSVEDFIATAQAERAAANFPAALVDLENALAKDPENRTARLLCAQLHIDLGDGEAAQGQLRHARQDHPDEAEAYLIKGFEANPDDPLAAAAMALHRLAQGKYQAALQWLRRS